MIDKLHRLARLMAPLKWPSLILTLAFAVAIAWILLSPPEGSDVLMIPCIIGFFAGLSAHSLIANFQSIPRQALPTDTWWVRVKIRYYRSVFWMLGLIFIITTLVFLSLAWKLLGIWFNE